MKILIPPSEGKAKVKPTKTLFCSVGTKLIGGIQKSQATFLSANLDQKAGTARVPPLPRSRRRTAPSLRTILKILEIWESGNQAQGTTCGF